MENSPHKFALAALLFQLAVMLPTEAASFTNTGTMTTARDHHTATLLPSGNILVTGGGINGIGDPTNRAELYNPTSGIWTAISNMTTNREYQTATLLPNGKVLVAGGFAGTYYSNNSSNRVWLATAELYDPTTGTWTATGGMTTNREYHTATLLPNGKVLVSGGFSGSGVLASAELYNPTSETWTAVSAMTTARYVHTATLLPNGKVLVAGGGKNGGGYLSSAELYDPSSGTWTNTGILINARNSHTATLLPTGKVLVAGGYNGINSLSSAELYDPSSGAWVNTGPLNIARRGHAAALLPNGKILVTGGFGDSTLASTELYNPSIQTWTPANALNIGRYSHTATLLSNGNVLVAGGYVSASGTTNSAELYGSPNVTVTAINLSNVANLPGGAFQFTFTNIPDMSFIVYSASNLSVSFSNWVMLNGPVEISFGEYQFTDPQVANSLQRYYRIRSP